MEPNNEIPKLRARSQKLPCDICGEMFYARGLVNHKKLMHQVVVETKIYLARPIEEPEKGSKAPDPLPAKKVEIPVTNEISGGDSPALYFGLMDEGGKFISTHEMSLPRLKGIRLYMNELIEKREAEEKRYREMPALREIERQVGRR